MSAVCAAVNGLLERAVMREQYNDEAEAVIPESFEGDSRIGHDSTSG
jgi:hypothetical protein